MHNVTEVLVRAVFSTPEMKELREETKANLKKGLFDYIVCCHVSVQYDPHFFDIWQLRMYPDTEENGAVAIGTGKRIHPYDACLMNGYAAHALDLDDVHSEIRGHPSAVILSNLFSLLHLNHDTSRFYEAYLIGVEVMTRLAKLLGKEHYEKGFHTTATAGLYGAVAAGAYFLEFSEERFNQAIDLCVTQLSGSRSHFGTVIKPLHAGITAQKAWQLLHFVRNGVAGQRNTITGENGLLSMYGYSREPEETLCGDWGRAWAIDRPGLWFKRYPCCSANAHPIEAAQDLIKHHSIELANIDAIRLYFPRNGDAALVHRFPHSGEEGRFSAEYCVALVLLGRALSIEAFSVDTIAPDVQTLMAKMTRVYDDAIRFAEVSYPKDRYGIVEIQQRDGTILKARSDVPAGSPGSPFQLEDLIDKARGLLNEKADQLIDAFHVYRVVPIDLLIEMEKSVQNNAWHLR